MLASEGLYIPDKYENGLLAYLRGANPKNSAD
jgi:hypothetical protein